MKRTKQAIAAALVVGTFGMAGAALAAERFESRQGKDRSRQRMEQVGLEQGQRPDNDQRGAEGFGSQREHGKGRKPVFTPGGHGPGRGPQPGGHIPKGGRGRGPKPPMPPRGWR